MPATGRYLLDINIIIALLEGEEAVISKLDNVNRVFIPAVALGELFFGAARSARAADNTAKIERFTGGRSVLPCDVDVAREYGRLKQALRTKGKPLPENDIWIAATAQSYNLILVGRDRHFREFDGLSLEFW